MLDELIVHPSNLSNGANLIYTVPFGDELQLCDNNKTDLESTASTNHNISLSSSSYAESSSTSTSSSKPQTSTEEEGPSDCEEEQEKNNTSKSKLKLKSTSTTDNLGISHMLSFVDEYSSNKYDDGSNGSGDDSDYGDDSNASVISTKYDQFKVKLYKTIEQVNYKTQYFYLIMMMLLFPMLLFFASLSTITVFFWIGYCSMMTVSLNLLAELAGSCWSWRVHRRIHRSNIPIPPQHLTAIISAYLPNEIDILEDTLMAMRKCRLPVGCTLTILVSHNGGKPHEKQRLRNIIKDLPPREGVTFDEADHPTSKSKAENVNGALDYLKESPRRRPQIVVLYDADHQPDENAIVYALETMIVKNADLLQGRCCINRGSTMIAAEFDTLYGINHPGGEVVHGFAFFGGTNGFWKFDLLDEIRMDTSMLTEDVDSAFRSLASGAHVVYDPMVVSFEEAPPCFQTLVKQRLRWTQGWSEVAVRHIPLIWKKEFSIRRRFMICFLLHFRELYFYTSSLVLPTAVVWGLRVGEVIISLPLLLVGICPLFLPIIMTLIARYQAGPAHVHPDLVAKSYVIYFLVSVPYETLKVMIAVLGHYRNLAGINKWEITSRLVVSKDTDTDKEPELLAVQVSVEAEQLIVANERPNNNTIFNESCRDFTTKIKKLSEKSAKYRKTVAFLAEEISITSKSKTHDIVRFQALYRGHQARTRNGTRNGTQHRNRIIDELPLPIGNKHRVNKAAKFKPVFFNTTITQFRPKLKPPKCHQTTKVNANVTKFKPKSHVSATKFKPKYLASGTNKSKPKCRTNGNKKSKPKSMSRTNGTKKPKKFRKSTNKFHKFKPKFSARVHSLQQ